MKIDQTEYHGEFEGRPFMLRVIEPSSPHGAWSGNAQQLRVWKVVPPPKYEGHISAMYEPVDDATVHRMEAALGQLRPEQIGFTEHRALGRVAVKVAG